MRLGSLLTCTLSKQVKAYLTILMLVKSTITQWGSLISSIIKRDRFCHMPNDK